MYTVMYYWLLTSFSTNGIEGLIHSFILYTCVFDYRDLCSWDITFDHLAPESYKTVAHKQILCMYILNILIHFVYIFHPIPCTFHAPSLLAAFLFFSFVSHYEKVFNQSLGIVVVGVWIYVSESEIGFWTGLKYNTSARDYFWEDGTAVNRAMMSTSSLNWTEGKNCGIIFLASAQAQSTLRWKWADCNQQAYTICELPKRKGILVYSFVTLYLCVTFQI